MSQRKLQLLVFTSGMCVMGVEMTGLRLLAPFFGTSLVVTTILIGSMMGFLSLGYYLGGRFGDKHPTLPSLGKVVAAASILVLIIPLIIVMKGKLLERKSLITRLSNLDFQNLKLRLNY